MTNEELAQRISQLEYQMANHQHLDFDNTKGLNFDNSFNPPATGGSPGGSNTELQFNDSGSFGGMNVSGVVTVLSFDKTTGVITTNGDGGDFNMIGASAAASSNGDGTNQAFGGGAGDGSGNGGSVTLEGGASTNGSGGAVILNSGASNSVGGIIQLNGANGGTSAAAGSIYLNAGTAGNPSGAISLTPGAPGKTNGNSGDILFNLSQGDGTGRTGKVSMSGDVGGNYHCFVSSILTSNATPTNSTTADSLDLANDGDAVFIEAAITAFSSGKTAAYIRRALYRNTTGTVAVVGSIQDDFTAESDAALDATFVVSGTRVYVQVTGVAATNMRWNVAIKYITA